MADLPTRAELFDAGAREAIARSEARAPANRIAPQAIYTEGGDANILLSGSSAMAEDVLRQHVKDQANMWLDSSRGPELDRLVLDRVSRQLPRKEASPALAVCTLTRTEGSFAAVNLDAGDIVRTKTGIEFELISAASVPAASRGPITVSARAKLAGGAGNVGPGQIVEIVESPDQKLMITNGQATGGNERETDASYRERARAWFSTARRGILAAIQQGALAVPGIVLATVEEQVDDAGDPTGYVFLYVADKNGQANSLLVSKVRDSLSEYRCCGIPPYIVGAVPEYVSIAYRLRFLANTDPQLAFDQLRFATVALANQTAPNKPLEISLLTSLARRVPGLIVRDDLLVTPIGDIYPSALGRVLRTTADRVTWVVA